MKRAALTFGALATVLILTAPPAGAVDMPFFGREDIGTYTVRTQYFSVDVGPNRDQHCTVAGDVYVPDGLGLDHRAPAILTSNGFGGSKDDQAGGAATFASHGYVVLSYSGLGFGGSTCKIFFADPDYDGIAAKTLVDYLGGQGGIAYTDPAATVPAPDLDVVRLDAPGDPRVGYLGGSYAGATGLATASVDPRVDTVAAMITWNDLARSLAPDYTGQTPVGPVKGLFGAGFFGAGAILTGPQGYAADPARAAGCPNYAVWVCDVAMDFTANRTPDAATLAAMRHVSPADYVDRINVPVLLAQGQKDSLFSLDEATATFDALRARGVETNMIWHSWGHNDRKPSAGEFDIKAPDPYTQHEAALVGNWLDNHLKDFDRHTGGPFTYYRDWIPNGATASPAYVESGTFPVGEPLTMTLGGGTLLRGRDDEPAPFSTTIRGAGSSLPSTIGIPAVFGAELPIPRWTVPGTGASWDGAVLADPVDVVGSPTLSISPTTTGRATVFVTLVDVGPDGTRDSIHGLVAPAVITDSALPVTISLPAVVHRFDRGHRIGIDITATDPSFAGGPGPADVTISNSNFINRLSLPVVPS